MLTILCFVRFGSRERKKLISIDAVLAGLFQFAERVFGVQIVPADGRTPVWHKDVRFFTVLDKARQVDIASFFLDPYARPANKRPGAWMNTCQGRSRLLGRLPVAYLVCNGSPPTGDKPSLMTLSDVETLWHEMGHGLQHMLTEVPYADAAGISGVEWGRPRSVPRRRGHSQPRASLWRGAVDRAARASRFSRRPPRPSASRRLQAPRAPHAPRHSARCCSAERSRRSPASLWASLDDQEPSRRSRPTCG
jgi:hypothetical protein